MAEAPTKKARTNEQPRTVIIGGGIGGCTAAIALAQAGAKVSIYEQAPQLMEIGAGINVQAVAIGVLERLGITEAMLVDPILGDGIITSKLEYYTVDGILIADEPVGRAKGDKYPQFSTHRAKFHNTLIAKAKEILGEENVHLDHLFSSMDRAEDGTITVHFQKMSKKGEASDKSTGIVAGHSYTLLNCVEIDKFRMMQLRNPWGEFEWNGEFSDGDPAWEKHPEVAKACKYENDKTDGCFWMDFYTWKKHYDVVQICHRTTKRDLALDVNESDGCCGVVKGCACGCLSYWCLCQGFCKIYCGEKTSEEVVDTGCCCLGNSGKAWKEDKATRV